MHGSRIAVTQRVAEVTSYRERRDCLDQRWSTLLERSGIIPVLVPNTFSEIETWVASLNIDGCILTGGNDLSTIPEAGSPAPERDRTEAALLDSARAEARPVLGVCRGFQMMNHYLGGSLTPVNEHVATRHTVSPMDPAGGPDGPISAHLKRNAPLEVNSFHDYGISATDLSAELIALLAGDDGSVEAAVHRELPWVGIMWHPEREEPFREHDIGLLGMLFRNVWSGKSLIGKRESG